MAAQRSLFQTADQSSVSILPSGAALSQLLVGKLDVHRTVRNVDVDDVAVLEQQSADEVGSVTYTEFAKAPKGACEITDKSK